MLQFVEISGVVNYASWLKFIVEKLATQVKSCEKFVKTLVKKAAAQLWFSELNWEELKHRWFARRIPNGNFIAVKENVALEQALQSNWAKTL